MPVYFVAQYVVNDAKKYCNWLNKREGIPRQQWCYEPNDEGKYAEGLKIPEVTTHL